MLFAVIHQSSSGGVRSVEADLNPNQTAWRGMHIGWHATHRSALLLLLLLTPDGRLMSAVGAGWGRCQLGAGGGRPALLQDA
jgi:hypothetical protein